MTLDLSGRTGKHDVGFGADEVRIQHKDRILDMAFGDILIVGLHHRQGLPVFQRSLGHRLCRPGWLRLSRKASRLTRPLATSS